jgi:hypothetical protein
MTMLQIFQGRFFAVVHVRHSLIQYGLELRIVRAVEVGDQRRQIKALLDRQPHNLFSDFSQTHTVKLNRIVRFGKITLAKQTSETL